MREGPGVGVESPYDIICGCACGLAGGVHGGSDGNVGYKAVGFERSLQGGIKYLVNPVLSCETVMVPISIGASGIEEIVRPRPAFLR